MRAVNVANGVGVVEGAAVGVAGVVPGRVVKPAPVGAGVQMRTRVTVRREDGAVVAGGAVGAAASGGNVTGKTVANRWRIIRRLRYARWNPHHHLLRRRRSLRKAAPSGRESSAG